MSTVPIVGLKGFSRWGYIDHYFESGFFPHKANWRASDEHKVWMAIGRCVKKSYIMICFSDGGTIAHEIANNDTNCIGLIAHSATFNPPRFISKIPVLLLSTKRDLTGMGWDTDRAEAWYKSRGQDVTKIILPRTTWHGHEFANGLRHMNDWALDNFGKALPIEI